MRQSNYYPFGLKHKGYNTIINTAIGNSTAQKFKYNGMELENSLGIDWYEMDMRQYDPAIARWTAIDPVTHHSMSTYTAFDNNPIYWADPSGADAYSASNGRVGWDGNLGSGKRTSDIIDAQAASTDIASTRNWATGETTFASGNSCCNEFEKAVVKNQLKADGHIVLGDQVRYVKPEWSKLEISNETITNLSVISRFTAISGIAWGALDLGMSSGTYLTTKGIRMPLYYANGQIRSARAAKFALQANLVKGVSHGLAITGVMVDSYGVYNYYFSDDPNAFVVHPAKAGLNTVMAGIGLYGGPPGWIISGIYFGVDATIGWDNAYNAAERIERETQKIMPNWTIFPRGPKSP